MVRGAGLGHPTFNNEQLRSWRHATSATLQDFGGAFVIPIVNDLHQQIDISIVGNALENVSAVDRASGDDVIGPQERRCMQDHAWKIK